jgi:cytochrome P450
VIRDIVEKRRLGETSGVEGGHHPGRDRDGAENGENADEYRRRDLLDLLLDAQKNLAPGQELTDDGIVDEALNFMTAGADTTSNLCDWMLYRILTQMPDHTNIHEVKEKDNSTALSRFKTTSVVNTDHMFPIDSKMKYQQAQTILQKVRAEIDQVCEGRIPGFHELKELRYLEAVIYESLRLHPPTSILPRYAIEDFEMTLTSSGAEKTITIPKGTSIFVNVGVIHRLPEYWPEPNLFKPERFLGGQTTHEDHEGEAPASSSLHHTHPTTASRSQALMEKAHRASAAFSFLGFSAGPRKCVGKNLALLEIKIIFTLFFQNFDFQILPDQNISPHPISRMPKNGLKVKLRRRTAPLNSHSYTIGDNSSTILKPLGMI